MWKRLLGGAVCAILFSSANAAQPGFAGCPQFFVGSKAPVVSTAPAQRRELCFSAFAVLHSGESKTPVYVAEKLNRRALMDGQGLERSDRFYEEARLPRSERAKLEDYRAGMVVDDPDAPGVRVRIPFDRGHMAPAADMSSEDAMAQSFSLANMVPQAPTNNRKTWKGLETATRKYVMRAEGDVYVFSGPAYTGHVQTLATGNVWVPRYLFKLVYDQAANRAWAHWLENTDSARAGRPITYEELVRRTGIEFLPGVSPRS